MPPLAPAPNTLGLHSPALGPWFSTDVQIPMPAAGGLTVDLTLGGSGAVSWLPPANGLLSLFVSTPVRPRGLAAYRGVDGGAAFADDRVVAVFRLLPWVEERLDALMAIVPSLAQNPVGGPTRPRVRALAMELTDRGGTPTDLESLLPDDVVFPPGVTSDEQKAAHLGLTWDGAALGNAAGPMTDLRQPGATLGLRQALLTFGTSANVRLWAFDHRGRPLDPGAVAQWWNFMATDASAYTNLWAAGATRTATVAAGRTIHLVNAHEGPLDAPSQRLIVIGATGSASVWTQTGTQAVTVTFGPLGADAVDDFPTAVAAVLPDGRYGGAQSLWATPTAGLTRDFARVALTSMELQLVGQPRGVPDAGGEIARRRAVDQNRASTGVRVARANRGALSATNEPVLTAIANTLSSGSATLVASVLNRDAGPVIYALPAGNPPTDLPAVTVRALEGGGTAADGLARAQHVFVDVQVDPSFVGAWVRVWPQGFDARRGEHTRLDGGSAPVDANGLARMVVPLADGAVSNTSPPRLGLDVWISTLNGPAHFADIRFDRPFPIDGERDARVPLGSAAAPFLVCSTGIQYAAALPAGSVPPGSEVVALGSDPPALIDRATIPDGTLDPLAAANVLRSGDVVRLTAPAWQTQSIEPHAMGDAVAVLSGTGADVQERSRLPFGANGVWTAGFPLPGMERLEVVASDVGTSTAAVGAVPLLGSLHDLNFHFHGHPGGPAAPEVHGTGVSLTGPAFVQVAEYVRDRAIGGTVALATDAAQNPIPVPGAPTADSLWAAGLRTEAAGVAAEIASGLIEDVIGSAYPFGGTWQDIQDFLGGNLGPTPVGTALTSATRALDRRMLAASRGAREGATALVAAIGRAEDFIYIETPAFDSVAFGEPGDRVDLWAALLQRMEERPALCVAICTPIFLMPGAPGELQRVRDELMARAQAAVLEETPAHPTAPTRAERFVVFSPAAGPGRSLRLASTTVVVDDAFVMTGTTHLWRRGLSFDSSYAVAVFDDRTQRGRPQEIVTFTQALMAGAMGVMPADLPDDPVEVITAIRLLVERGGLGRLAAERIRPPDPALTTVDAAQTGAVTDRDIWNPDGSFPDLDPFGWLFGLRTAVYDDVFNPP